MSGSSVRALTIEEADELAAIFPPRPHNDELLKTLRWVLRVTDVRLLREQGVHRYHEACDLAGLDPLNLREGKP